MNDKYLFKFGSKLLNPLTVAMISLRKGRRGSYHSDDRKIYRDKHRVPFRKGWYHQEHCHHPLYSKIYYRQPWYVRWYVLESPQVVSWNDSRVDVWSSSGERLASMSCQSNNHSKEIHAEAMKNWTDALSKYASNE